MENRLDELDLLRGLSVIGMILVITPGAWGVGFDWLNHADWEGVVAVDMIAPAFLFCVGFAMPLSIGNRIKKSVSSFVIARQIVQRGSLLILIGILVHMSGNSDLSTLRIPGVLQRIGLTYIAVSILLLYVGRKQNNVFQPSVTLLSIITFIVLMSAWALLNFVPVPGSDGGKFSSEHSWASYIDQVVFGVAHMWEWGQTDGVVTYDPDGLYASFTTCGNVLIGAIVGLLYQNNSPYYTKLRLFIFGVVLVLLGCIFSLICPIIKKIWTSSFVLVSSGFSVIIFSILAFVKDYELVKKLSHPLYAYGANALFGFTISWLGLFWFLDKPWVGNESLRSLGFSFWNTFIDSKALASLMFGVSFIVILYIVLAYMRHRRWYIRL